MANKSIKFKDNHYIDSTGVVHNRGLLSTLLNNILDDITYLKNRCVYSTNEIAIGKWIDGKTLYRKVLTGTKASSSDEISLSTPTNINTMVDVKIQAKNDTEAMSIPNISISYASGNTYRGYTYLNNNATWNKNHVYIVGVTNFTSFHAVIEYTKN